MKLLIISALEELLKEGGIKIVKPERATSTNAQVTNQIISNYLLKPINLQGGEFMLTILTRIPWGTILKYAPHIIALAKDSKDLFDSTKGTKQGPLSLDNLSLRIQRLENNEEKESKLILDIANQSQELTTALSIVSRRLTIALITSGIAVLLAVLSIIVILIR